MGSAVLNMWLGALTFAIILLSNQCMAFLYSSDEIAFDEGVDRGLNVTDEDGLVRDLNITDRSFDRNARGYGDAVDTLCGKYTTKRVKVKASTIGTFTVQRRTKRCIAYYTVEDSCSEMKLTCSSFFVDNRDPIKCKKGDRFLVKVSGHRKPMSYCKNHKPTERFPVLSKKKMKVWFVAENDVRYKSKFISCQVECYAVNK